ncbi:MAG: HipA domain-containing protein [Polyangiaceae bacterium]
MRHVKTADVYRDGELAGQIERTDHGASFRYLPAFLERHGAGAAIAFRLPPSREPVVTHGANLHTFFAGLLPEGQRFVALSRRVKTSRDDLLTLLMAAGADCIGDVSVTPHDAPPRDATPSADLGRLEELDFEALFAESLAFPGVDEQRATAIPGVQRKVSASMISFPLRARHRGKAYILKLNPPEHPRIVENEAFFMAMAAACGIRVAPTELVVDAEGHAGLLVERFDRVPAASGGGHRLHQEDACQLLDRYPADKYNLALADVFDGVRAVCSVPIVAAAQLLRQVAFSFLVGNGDLHAKNVSVIVTAAGRVELTPAYDLLSTLPYGDTSMALAMEGRDAKLRRHHFLAFGARHRLRERAVRSMLDELCDEAPAWLDRLPAIGLEPRLTERLRAAIVERREALGA